MAKLNDIYNEINAFCGDISTEEMAQINSCFFSLLQSEKKDEISEIFKCKVIDNPENINRMRNILNTPELSDEFMVKLLLYIRYIQEIEKPETINN